MENTIPKSTIIDKDYKPEFSSIKNILLDMTQELSVDVIASDDRGSSRQEAPCGSGMHLADQGGGHLPDMQQI